MTEGKERLENEEPPHNLEIEQALLGALLSYNEAFYRVNEIIKSECFYNPAHGRIYEAIESGILKNQVVTPMTLKNQFHDDPGLEDVGGAAYLARLAASATTINNAPDYAKHIVDHYTRRMIMDFSNYSASEAFHNDEMDPSEFINDMEEQLHQIRPNSEKQDNKPVDVGAMFDETLQTIDDAHNSPGLVGVTTGLHWLNERIGGFRPSRLYILAGRPGMGKTAIAVYMGLRAAEQGKGVLFFSLEMPKQELGTRMLTCMAAATKNEIHYSQAEKGKLGDDQRQVLVDVAAMQSGLNFHTIDKAGLRLSQIRLWSMRHKRNMEKQGKTLDVIFIDYLQIMQPDSRYRGNKTNEIAEISMGLKNLSKELKIPIVCLSQLSRNLEQRENKRPMLSDLRDSGSIEQDADVVLFVYRDEYYLQKDVDSGHMQKHDALEKSRNKIELITSKQRGGSTGTDYFYCDVATNYFRELTKDEKPDN